MINQFKLRSFYLKDSGSFLRVGEHHVNYVAIDSSGNRATCSFVITVKQDQKQNQNPQPNLYHNVVMCPHVIIDGRMVPSYMVSRMLYLKITFLRSLTKYFF